MITPSRSWLDLMHQKVVIPRRLAPLSLFQKEASELACLNIGATRITIASFGLNNESYRRCYQVLLILDRRTVTAYLRALSFKAACVGHLHLGKWKSNIWRGCAKSGYRILSKGHKMLSSEGNVSMQITPDINSVRFLRSSNLAEK